MKYSMFMTRKSILMMSIVFMIYLSIASVRIATAQATEIRVEPATMTLGPDPYPVGTEFTVDITIYDVANLYGWEVKAFWDNTILNCTAEEYPFFPAGNNWEDPNNIKLGPGIDQDYNASHGRWYHGLSALPMSEPHPVAFTGTLKLATLTFEVLDLGETTIELAETKLADDDASPIDHTTLTSAVTIVPEFPVSMIVPLFIIATLVVVVARKTVWSKER